MAHNAPDRDSARVTAVMHSLDESPLPAPRVEAVEIDGNEARVYLSGSNGLHAVVRLRQDGSHWVVRDVTPAVDPIATPAPAPPSGTQHTAPPSGRRAALTTRGVEPVA